MFPAERISRFLTYLLRHRPKDYRLSFDGQGFVSWGELIDAVRERFPDASEDDIRGVVQGSEKKRFEFKDGKVRATYGHSFPIDLGLEPTEPPGQLYFGTARDLAQAILRDGLKPRDRQYVHLSSSFEEALAVGKRRDPFPAVVVVDARMAHTEGIHFFSSGPLFLVDNIPPKYLSLRQPS